MLFPGLKWNDEDVGEIGMTTATASVFGVPFIFISGDRAAVQEARAFVPELEAVITKEPLFTHVAGVFDKVPVLTLSPQKSRDLIRAGARRALERIAEIPVPSKPPFNPLEA
jgi:D-aminopeptidase